MGGWESKKYVYHHCDFALLKLCPPQGARHSPAQAIRPFWITVFGVRAV